MERPASQAENFRPSGLKPPSSRLPAPASSAAGRTLVETSQSDLNARSLPHSGLMAPSIIPSKHKVPGLPEPVAKRKTLAERAAEPINPNRSHLPGKLSISRAAEGGILGSRVPSNGFRPHASQSSISSIGRPQSRGNVLRQTFSNAPIPRLGQPHQDEEEEEADAGVMGKRKAWDTKGRLEDMEDMYKQLRSQFASAADSKTALEESISVYKMQLQESAQSNRELTATNRNLMSDLDRMRSDLHMTTTDLKQARRDQERDALDAERRYERQLADLISKHENEMQRAERERERATEKLKKEMEDAKRSWQEAKDEESREMINEHWDEMDQAKKNHEEAMAALQSQLDVLRQAGESRATESASEVQSLREKLSSLESQLEASKSTIASLRARIAAEESKCATLEHDKASLISKTHFLEGNQEAQSEEFTTMRKELDEAKKAMNETLDTLRKEEVLRRKLNATILELRGNIRVYTRMRPLLKDEDDPAKVEFPDADSLEGGKEMVVYAPTVVSATGKERNEKHNYSFDRTFAPGTPNNKVFDECRDLIQSVVDGYNVSILSYGQTGSGKTYGMSGPDGIIPSSIGLLLSEMQRVKEKGWEYEVDASFVEVYNETLNDLLGDAKTWDDGSDSSTKGKKKEKHEVHHDPVTGKTSVSNINSISLWPAPEGEGRRLRSSPSKNNASDISESASYIEETVAQLLETSNKNRRVAATKANERSSRSHSIFILTLRGHCDATGDKSEGVLNLVDLAGCERLNESGAEGNRKKETQAINKSLSALGDVIAALGEGKTHIPYRNSKLTYLLQNSLGGTATNGKSSRTLMLLHLSPLQQHYQESKNSLLFGSKVHSTHIGSAKKR